MPDNHDRLLDILKKEYELYEELYKIAGEKKDILLKEDIDQLAELVSEEEGLLLELKELEEERLSLEMDSIHLKDEFIELKKQLKNG